jgi:hypothetical protein
VSEVGDLSPKDFHPQSQRLIGLFDFLPETGSSRLLPTNVSAKHRLPEVATVDWVI